VAIFSCPRAVRSNRHKWRPGPVTTVLGEHKRPKAFAAAKNRIDSWRWFTERSSGGFVVHGNNPIRVRLTEMAALRVR